MARKTKEEALEKLKTKKITTKPAESKKTAVKSVARKTGAKKVAKTSSTKKTPSKKTTQKDIDNKSINIKNDDNLKKSKVKTNTKDLTSKDTSKKKSTSKTKVVKSTVPSIEEKVDSKNKKSTAASKEKKISSKAKTTKRTPTSSKEKKATTQAKAIKSTTNTKSKKTTKKSAIAKTTKKVSSRKTSKKVILDTPEYYDLPYRYNKTVVKVLAQNPNTLFVYWDISDEDRLNFEKNYGNDFFTKTRPVLVIHNLTDNYTFEIDINDFANNWYVNVNDTKCKYFVELGRRPYYNDVINKPINYLNIAFSNTIEIPNDHILFFKENDKIYFKNIKTNKITEKIIKTYNNSLHGIYKTYNLTENIDRFDFKNPSSQNPSSSLL